jgi:cullin 3
MIPEQEIKSHIIPLISKINILLKYPNTKDFNMTDTYTLNPTFKNNLTKITVPVALPKEIKVQEKNEVSEKVDEDRRHMIEAAIVKVMKTRRKLEHNALVAETTKILSQKFNPDPVMIKKRIESLIEREYMERDNEDRRYYKYIA